MPISDRDYTFVCWWICAKHFSYKRKIIYTIHMYTFIHICMWWILLQVEIASILFTVRKHTHTHTCKFQISDNYLVTEFFFVYISSLCVLRAAYTIICKRECTSVFLNIIICVCGQRFHSLHPRSRSPHSIRYRAVAVARSKACHHHHHI